eukprot:3719358-Pyramimonas_sp.AAC.1
MPRGSASIREACGAQRKGPRWRSLGASWGLLAVLGGGALLPMTPKTPGRTQDDLQDGSRYPKMPQYGSHDAPTGPKTATRRLQVAR